MSRRGVTLLVGAVLLVGLGLTLTALPVPYVALGPGPTVDTLGSYNGKRVIALTGRPRTVSAGHLNLTTVSVFERLDLATAVRRWFDRRYAVVPREVVFPPGETDKQITQENVQEFKDSQEAAQTAALRQLGYPVQTVVKELSKGSPSTGRLSAGDVLSTVDGTAVTSRTRLIALITAHKPGEIVTVGYRRAGRPGTVTVTTVAAAGDASRAVIGVAVEQRQPHPFRISFEIDKIGGPSAGLMFALGIVDLLTPADLTGGRFIAGTGAIDDEGKVQPIGGIQQKIIAASAAGASVFLTPADNCTEALRGAPSRLRLVKVSSLADALTALRTLRTGQGSLPSCRS